MHKEKYTPDFVHRFSLARQEDDFFISFDDFLLKLKEDVEFLLNSYMKQKKKDSKDLEKTFLFAGLSHGQDVTKMKKENITAICTEVKELLLHFEPRLKEVSVNPSEDEDIGVLAINVAAELNWHPYLSPISFDASVSSHSSTIRFKSF